MTLKEKLFKRLPKKYHKYIRDINEEWDLDDAKYMVYFTAEGAKLDEGNTSLPFRSFNEVYEFLKAYSN